MLDLESLKLDLQNALSSPENYKKNDDLIVIQKRYSQIETDIKLAEDEWSAALEKFDQYSKDHKQDD